MSGEETLAQVYREVESPKLPNFKKVGLIVFIYSLLLTGSMTFLAVLLIPDKLRMTTYYDNWMGGLAMQMIGPVWLLLMLNAFVVFVGFLILSGAVNTSIVGSNGVLSRVAEDGVLPDWFLKPHPRFGTNYRLLYMIAGLQLITILASRGDVILLGEAYAFGVVWSFVFNTLSMVVLRFKMRGPAGVPCAVQHSLGKRLPSDRPGIGVPYGVRIGVRKFGYETGRHDQRLVFCRRVPFGLYRHGTTSIAAAAARNITSTSSSSIAKQSIRSPRPRWV